MLLATLDINSTKVYKSTWDSYCQLSEGWGKDQKLDVLIDSFTAKITVCQSEFRLCSLYMHFWQLIFLVLKAFHSMLLFWILNKEFTGIMNIQLRGTMYLPLLEVAVGRLACEHHESIFLNSKLLLLSLGTWSNSAANYHKKGYFNF